MHVAIRNHVLLCVRRCRGIAAVIVYIALHTGPVSVGSHPVYSFNLVVRRSVVALFRRESYRCLVSVLSTLVCHLVLWLLWVVPRAWLRVGRFSVAAMSLLWKRPKLASRAGRTGAAWRGM